MKVSYNLYTYGSYANGLCLPNSDIDLLIEFQDEYAAVSNLETLSQHLASFPFIKESKFIKFTAVPVLKIETTSEYDFFKVDITLKDTTH